MCNPVSRVLACGEEVKEGESVSASARVRDRRENRPSEREVPARVPARPFHRTNASIVKQARRVALRGVKTTRAEDQIRHLIVWSSLGTAAAGGQPTPRGREMELGW